MLVWGVLAAVGLADPPEQPRPEQERPQQSRVVSTSSNSVSPAADLFSLERIRKQLRRQPVIVLAGSDLKLPVYRTRIEGYEFRLPSWKDGLALKTTSRVPPGGEDFNRVRWLATKPTAWGVPW